MELCVRQIMENCLELCRKHGILTYSFMNLSIYRLDKDIWFAIVKKLIHFLSSHDSSIYHK